MGFDIRRPLNHIPLLGGLGSSIWGDPDQDRMQDALAASIAEAKRVQPLMHQRDLTQARQTMGAYAPVNDLIGQMYGPGAKIDLGALLADPNPPGMYEPLPPPPVAAPPPAVAPPAPPRAVGLPPPPMPTRAPFPRPGVM